MSLKRKLGIVLASTLLSLAARADFTVLDPNNALSGLDSMDHGMDFAQAMTCGQSTVDQGNTTSCQMQCNDTYCSSQCDQLPSTATAPQFKLTIGECSDAGVWVFGDNGLRIFVTPDDYKKAGNYWVLGFLRSIGQWISPEGSVTITDVMPFFGNYIENGKKTGIKILMMHGNIQFPTGQANMGFELWLTPDLDGVRQVQLFRMDSNVFVQNRGLIL